MQHNTFNILLIFLFVPNSHINISKIKRSLSITFQTLNWQKYWSLEQAAPVLNCELVDYIKQTHKNNRLV